MTPTQQFEVGESVAWVDSNNHLRYGVIEPDDAGDERVSVRYGRDPHATARPTRDRVAHIIL